MGTRHLVIDSFGFRLGLQGLRVSVRNSENGTIKEFPLSRLKTVTISSDGISISTDLLRVLGIRGIPVFMVDYRGEVVSLLSGPNFHGTAKIRQHQFKTLEDSSHSYSLAKSVLTTKIKNQKAVLSYFQKYLKKSEKGGLERLSRAIESLHFQSTQLSEDLNIPIDSFEWRPYLLGIEGYSAKVYWEALIQSELFPRSFLGRVGRGATDPVNQALNYGYGILSSQVWRAISIAGLEAYSGFLHTDRPGKPSLVLDLMEEYRPWLVDRQVIKLRSDLSRVTSITPLIRRKIISSIQKSLRSEVVSYSRRILLETLIQRQVFRFSGSICEKKSYRGHVFKW